MCIVHFVSSHHIGSKLVTRCSSVLFRRLAVHLYCFLLWNEAHRCRGVQDVDIAGFEWYMLMLWKSELCIFVLIYIACRVLLIVLFVGRFWHWYLVLLYGRTQVAHLAAFAGNVWPPCLHTFAEYKCSLQSFVTLLQVLCNFCCTFSANASLFSKCMSSYQLGGSNDYLVDWVLYLFAVGWSWQTLNCILILFSAAMCGVPFFTFQGFVCSCY